MTEIEQQILTLIRVDPQITQAEIANSLGVSHSVVIAEITKLTTKGLLGQNGIECEDAPYVVVVGGMNMDIHGESASTLRLHDSNPGSVRTSPGGVARNIAENLARLGSDCRLISIVGKDAHGDLLLKHGRESGIDMQHVLQVDTAHTATYMSVLDTSREMHVAISDTRVIDQLGPERLRVHEQLLKRAALIAVDTNLNNNALAWLTNASSDQVLFVDTVSTAKAVKIEPYLHAVHTLKPSLSEAEAIAGFSVDNDSLLGELADWFHVRGVQRIFITLGERGVFYSTEEERGSLGPRIDNCQVRNADGAGDAFLSGLAYAWLNQWDIKKTVAFAMAAASVTISHEQTNSPDLSLAAVTRFHESNYAI